MRLRQGALPGEVWVMPTSHWHFEFHDGSRDWLADALGAAQVDPACCGIAPTAARLNLRLGNHLLEPLLRQLLEKLTVSDFLLAFPGRPVLCLAHHHRQLWWTTTDAAQVDQAADCGLGPFDDADFVADAQRL
jgi:hypothetical protein